MRQPGLGQGKREVGGRVAIYVEEKMFLKSNYSSRAALDDLFTKLRSS